MSKLQLALVSLIAAIPGGILTVLLVLAFLGNADKMSGMMWAVSVPTLLASVLAAAMPVAVMLFGPSLETADGTEVEDEMAAEEFGEGGDSLGGEEHSGEFDSEPDVTAGEGDELSMDEVDEYEFEDSTETVSAETEDLFMEDDDFGLESDEDEK